MKLIFTSFCAIFTVLSLVFWMDFLAHNFYTAEWLLAKAGLNWWVVPVTARLIVALAFAKVISVLISPSGWSKFFWIVGVVVLLVLTEGILFMPFGRHYENPFTSWFYHFPIRIIYYSFTIIIGFILSAQKLVWSKKEENPASFFSLTTVVIFGAMFCIRPMYIDDYEARQSTPLKDASLLNARINREQIESNKVHLFYFSTGCDHCYYQYHRLEACADRLKRDRYLLCLQGSDEQLIRFTHGRRVPFHVVLLEDPAFFLEAGPGLPASYFMENGRNTQYLVGDQFNYRTLNYLCNEK